VAWDSKRYQQEVLVPARKAGEPPGDLFVLYGFGDRLPGSKDAFDQQVATVVVLWNAQRSKPGWGPFIEKLQTRHAALKKAGELTPEAFTAIRKREKEEAERIVSDLVKQLNATHISADTVSSLRKAAGGSADEDQIRRALASANIAVLSKLPDLPASEPSGYAAISTEVRALRKNLAAEIVFGDQAIRAGSGFRVLDGFRLADGRKVDEQALNALSAKAEKMPFPDPGKAPTNRLVTALKKARTSGTLDKLLLWEVIAPLRDQAKSGVFGQKAIAAQGIRLGLDRNEAGIIAAALVSSGLGTGRSRQVEEDLTAGRLREAQRNAALVDEDELRAKVEAAVAKVADLVAKAESEQAAGRTEQAARLLAEAAGLAKDDEELPQRLAAIAPPAPRDCVAVIEGGKIVVTWQPGAGQASAGEIGYQVTRGTDRTPSSPAQGIPVGGRTGELHATDTDPPAGVDIRYAVFAGRGGPQWSAAGPTATVVYAPEVTDVKLQASSDAVTASWRAPKGATQVKVTREASGRKAQVTADLTGFSDTGLTPGVECVYQITAVYRSADGVVRTSAGIIKQATPVPDPLPVLALTLQGSPPVVEAVWAPPKFGRVELLIGARQPTWKLGAEPGDAELKEFGRPLPGAPRRAGDKYVMTVETPSGRHYLLAVTRSGHRAVVGAWTELNLATPVTKLVAERLGDQARLSWAWPQGAVEAIVTWPGGERRCTFRQYHTEGGFAIPVGSDEATVTVRAVHPDQHSELIAAPAKATVPGQKARVSYHWLKAGPLQSSRRLLQLTTDRPCELPELVVVQSTAKFPPDEATQGVEIVRLPPVAITPGHPVKLPVDLPRKASGFLACFIADKSDGGPLLFPPPPAEMKIK
jgi:hypothetical protein